MLAGALIGAGIGIGVALISLLFRKPRECPECGEWLRMPWVRPLEECPHCGEPLVDRRRSSASGESLLSSRKALVASLVLILGGLVILIGFLVPALESRRVWRHQERQIDLRQAELHDLEQRDDPESRARANELRAELRRGWEPEAHREEFVQRAPWRASAAWRQSSGWSSPHFTSPLAAR